MWTHRGTWIGAFLLAALALAAAVANFGAAFPVVSLDLEVTRAQVLERARERARRHAWEMEDAREAASFGLQDRAAKTYVELEGGGRDVWEEVVSRGEYHPYLWTVRLFRSGRTREVRVRFAPDGRADGFSFRLPDDEPGAALPGDSARALAEARAEEAWGSRLGDYRLVETASETLPGGRVDHEFVYERTGGPEVGEARFRLLLGVAGDRLAEVRRFVLVPESFSRRYREMRSSNDLLAFLATAATGVLYVLAGLGGGLFLLLRRGGLRWSGALVAGFAVSGLLFGARLNQIPLAWMGYDTAVPEGAFLLRQVGVAGAVLVGGGLLLAGVFAVGEGLTRVAFPDQPRLWRSWSRGVANARGLLGRTLGGYLFTALFIPYSVGFYFLSTRLFGWWTPAEALVQPDLVATPMPWLSAVSTALFAGTFEEALFRAVPLAGAALLGARTGRRKTWIGGALLVQAVIFATAHANYPQQPSYARAVELFLPSLAFGAIYLRHGLVPAVIGHYTFDLAWMSLPLWASTAPGIRVDQAAVVVAGLAPLGVVAAARLRWGARAEVPEEALNRSAGPAVASTDGEEATTGAEAETGERDDGVEPGRRGRSSVRALVAVGAGGLVLWAGAEDRPAEGLGLEVSRERARALAADTLEARGVETGSPWRLLARPDARRGDEHRFAVEALGAERYRELLGSYLEAPGWEVRLARFSGTATERAEEWRVRLDGRGRVVRVRHLLAEETPGDSLSEAEARRTALDAVGRRYGLSPEELEPVTAEAHQRPARRDWTFEFRDRTVHLERGRPRIRVRIAGARLVDVHRGLEVPQEWRRMDRSRGSRHSIRSLAGGGVLLFGAGALLLLALVRWSRGRFGVRSFVAVGGVLLVGFLGDAANGLPTALAAMSTSEPLSHQLLTLAGSLLLAGLFLGAGGGLLAGLVAGWRRSGLSRWPRSLAVGLAGGLGVAGLGAVAGLGEPVRLPPWPDHAGAGHALGWLEPALAAGTGTLLSGALALGLLTALEVVARDDEGGVRLPVAGFGCLLLGYAFAALEVGPSTGAWLLAGALWSAAAAGVVALIRREGRGVLPGVVAIPVLLEQGSALLTPPFPGARPGAALAVAVALGVAALWTRGLAGRSRP